MIGQGNGAPAPAPQVRETPVPGENVRCGTALINDCSNDTSGSVAPKTVGQPLPQNSMRSAALFRAFRHEMRAWLETMDKLEDPSAQLSEAQRQQLFEIQEVRYQHCQHSLDKLLRAKRSSHATNQMKVDAFCEYAAGHLYDNVRFAVYALLVIRELTQQSGLSPAAIDRLGETCR